MSSETVGRGSRGREQGFRDDHNHRCGTGRCRRGQVLQDGVPEGLQSW